MYYGAIAHDRIIAAFQRHVPGCYVRDYREQGGYITICRNYKDVPWRDQTTTRQVYRQVPAVTLCSIPKGNVTAPTHYEGLRLVRPGWRQEFKKAMRNLSYLQQKAITRTLGVGEVFPGVIA